VASRRLPDIATLRRQLDSGKKYSEVGELYGVSGQAVWSMLNRHGATKEQVTIRELIPWQLEEHHRGLMPMVRFRTILSIAQGLEVADVEWRRLESWLEQLRASGVVVGYHKDAPPNEASKTGGWYYVLREPGDEWIIRLPVREELPPLARKLVPYGFDLPRHLPL